jgi:hypothetical protein
MYGELETAVALTKTEKLTNTAVARLAYATDRQSYIVRDVEIGGFHLRVTPHAKTFKFVCDVVENGKRVTRGFTIGVNSAEMTADVARIEAKRLALC